MCQKCVRVLEEFLKRYKDVDEEIYCIGGGMIYSEMLAYADKLVLTEIDEQADAEVYFPEFDKSLYTKTILSDIRREWNSLSTCCIYFKITICREFCDSLLFVWQINCQIKLG